MGAGAFNGWELSIPFELICCYWMLESVPVSDFSELVRFELLFNTLFCLALPLFCCHCCDCAVEGLCH